MDDEKFQAYEELSRDVLLATLGNPMFQKQGIHLADVYMNMPERDVVKAKKVLSYIGTVNKLNFGQEIPNKETERLLRRAMDLPSSEHSTLGIMEHLGVGLYTARRLVSILKGFETEARPAKEERSSPAPSKGTQ